MQILCRNMWNVKYGTNMDFMKLLRRRISQSSRDVADMAAKDGELRVFIVSGEVSGDTIGSRLMSSLNKFSTVPVRFAGVGGSMMSKQGLKSLFPMEDISVMGIWELLPHLYKFTKRLSETIEAAYLFRPHVVVTVDSKGFSFRLLKQLRARYSQQESEGPVHFHYVAPSFWAWKGGEARLRGLANFVDHVLCILPNEEAVCRSNGLAATFVGHPILEDVLQLHSGKEMLLNEWKIEGNCDNFCRQYEVPSGATLISLLPGSRLQEVTRMLPIFANSIQQLKDLIPELITAIHVAPNQQVADYVAAAVQKWPVPTILIPGGSPSLKYDVFSASRAAICTSGTVAVELQLARLPCLVAYRAHILTEWFIRYKAKIPYVSLPNILLNSAIIPEALFRACTPTNLASLLMELINNKELQEKQIIAAEKFVKYLYPSNINVLDIKDARWKSIHSPSVLAAATILSYRRLEA